MHLEHLKIYAGRLMLDNHCISKADRPRKLFEWGGQSFTAPKKVHLMDEGPVISKKLMLMDEKFSIPIISNSSNEACNA